MAAEFRLLCVGDIHLGRRPGRLSAGLDDFNVRTQDLTPAAAWAATVDWALEHDVDAVALAGDVVESLEDRFEAYGHLERGVRRLTGRGIDVVGVAGNHDVLALPRLADRIPDFKLLGRKGQWETIRLRADSGAELCLMGWSFPEPVFRGDPLAGLALELPSGVAAVGLLHCDLDQTNSPYAPVPRRAFDSAPGAAWLLGHVHGPSDLSAVRPVGYLGSLVGLDPGEPGLHGPWLARISGDARVSLEQVPLAPIRWEAEPVAIDEPRDVAGDGIEDALVRLFDAAMQAVHDRIEPTLGETQVVGCRLRLTGRSKNHRSLLRAADNRAVRGYTRTYDDVVYFVEKIIDDAGPALDLQRLSETSDPPGLLARRVLALQNAGPEVQQLLAAGRDAIEAAGQFARNADDAGGLSEERTRELLVRAGVAALEELLVQRDEGERDDA